MRDAMHGSPIVRAADAFVAIAAVLAEARSAAQPGRRMKLLLGTLVVLAAGCRPDERCELRGRVSPAGPAVVYLVGSRHEWPQTTELKFHRRELTPTPVVLQRGDTIAFHNSDETPHRIHARSFGDEFQLPRRTRGPLGERTFEATGHVRISCDEHPDERADVLVLENRQFTHVASDGSWMLPRVRAGAHTLVAWSPDGATASRHIDACREPTDLVLAPGRAPGP